MALSATLLNQIRDEIGSAETDFDDNALEAIYNDTARGGFNVLSTAIIVFKRRLANLGARSFDAASAGGNVVRSQRIKFYERRIKELMFRSDDGDFTGRAANVDVLSTIEQDTATAEFS